MKRVILIASLLSLGACASAPTMQTRYALDVNNNLTQEQYMVDSGSACEWGNFNWCIAGGIAVGVLVGVWGLDRIYSNNETQAEPAPQSNPLIQTSGSQQSSWEGSFIQPVYQEVQ